MKVIQTGKWAGNMKKGLLPVLLAVVVATTAAGCGGRKSSESKAAEYAAKTESVAPMTEQPKAEAKMAEPANSVKREESKPAPGIGQNPGRSVLPNGQRYEDAFFKDYGVNPFVQAEEEPLSTFSADVDTASYSIARNYLKNGSLPPAEAVRVEEFINYFKQDYPAPRDEAFAIYTEAAPSKFGEGYHLVQIGLQGKKLDVEERKDASLTFVIDVSGSMDRENRLELVKKSLRILIDQMGSKDKIGIAVYGTNGRKLLDHTNAVNKKQIMEAINELRPEGSTNAAEGLQIGYEMASRAFVRGGINRVILCTDGVANQGITRAEDILKTIEDYKEQGIYLTALGFGMENYNDVLLEKLADKGNGQYGYIDDIDEAKKIFLEQLTGTLQVIAKDVKAQVEFNPEKVERYRLLGYENRALSNEEFRDNRVDAGEVGSGHTVIALYEVKLKNNALKDLGTVRIRYKNPETDRVSEMTKRLSAWDVGKSFEDASTRFRFTACVAEFAEVLRG
ncbi:MAG: von Willebrand factor type A domain-containing protein, partial [Clostridia bacterium]|nr:von Willebrand factor type A domain-containing protein [Clostridia bacterium]